MNQYFSRQEVLNTLNAHMWALWNPHGTRPWTAQGCFTVNVWMDIVTVIHLTTSTGYSKISLFGRFFSKCWMVSLHMLDIECCFNGAVLLNKVRKWLFGPKQLKKLHRVWRSCHMPALSPPPQRSFYLPSLGFFFLGVMESIVNSTPVNSEFGLVSPRISIAAAV